MAETPEDLWNRYVSGDPGAWALLCTRLWKPVRRFFANKSYDEADELTQRTFRRLQEVRDRYAGRASIRSFVFGIARLIYLEFIRERRKGAQIQPESVSVAALQPGASSLLCHRAEARLVLEALRRLPLDDQIVIELVYWEELSAAEVADVIDVDNVHTARGRLHRARERLRKLIVELERDAPLVASSANFESWVREVREQL